VSASTPTASKAKTSPESSTIPVYRRRSAGSASWSPMPSSVAPAEVSAR